MLATIFSRKKVKKPCPRPTPQPAASRTSGSALRKERRKRLKVEESTALLAQPPAPKEAEVEISGKELLEPWVACPLSFLTPSGSASFRRDTSRIEQVCSTLNGLNILNAQSFGKHVKICISGLV